MEERNDTYETSSVAGRRYFVVRQEYLVPATYAKLCEEIRVGRIREGWGIAGLDLRHPKDHWIESYLEGFRTTDRAGADSRFEILKRLLDIKPGDRVIVPKQPDYRHFMIGDAVKSNSSTLLTSEQQSMAYEFDTDSSAERGELDDDFRHVVNVDPSSVRVLAYTGSLDLELIKRKMRAYGSAVNNAWDSDFRAALERVRGDSERPIDDSIDLGSVIHSDAILPVVGTVLEKLRCLPPSRLEKLIEILFVGEGFDVAGNRYDRKGGDIDRTFTLGLNIPRIVTEFCPTISSSVALHVQIKQKCGVDQNDFNDLNQLILMRPEKPSALQRDIFISTADSFTPECRHIAQREDIALVDGRQLAQMVMRLL